MIDDIVYENDTTFILEKGSVSGGEISSYSLDGASYDFTASESSGEVYF